MQNPLLFMQLWNRASEDTKNELKRTSIGAGADVVREGIELYRLFDEPTKEEVASRDLRVELESKEREAKEKREGKTRSFTGQRF